MVVPFEHGQLLVDSSISVGLRPAMPATLTLAYNVNNAFVVSLHTCIGTPKLVPFLEGELAC